MPTIRASLALGLSACIDLSLLDSGSTTSTVSGVDATWTVGEPTEDTTGATATCTEVPPVSWEITEEWRYEMPHFVMNLVAAPQPGDDHATLFMDWGKRLRALDGRDGSEVFTSTVPETLDDGSTPAVGNTDGVPGLEYVTPRWQAAMVYDVADDAWTTIEEDEPGDDEIVALADIDQDGLAEVVLPSGSYALDGTPVAAYPGFGEMGGELTVGTNGLLLADLDGDSFPEAVNARGIWNPRDGSGHEWAASIGADWWFYGATVDVGGVTQILFQSYTGDLFLANIDGTVASSYALGLHGFLPAFGDADGDGTPEMCTADETALLLVGLDGTVLQRWDPATDVAWGITASGGCSMADLDGDGDFEVLAQNQQGLFVFDGATGDELIFEPAYSTTARDTAPIVADVDGDGSAEIALIVSLPDSETQTVVVLGPAKGRWARTRPVWNQFAYDVTSVRDDGTIIASPLAPSTTYGGVFRAQPAHDGLLADLSVDFAIAETTKSGDVVLEFTVHNLGSADESAGTRLALRSFDGSAWSELSTFSLAEPLPAGSIATGSVTVAAADLGSRLVFEATGIDPECDRINDRSDEIRR